VLQWNLGLGRRAETRGLVVPAPDTGEPVVKNKGSYALLIGSAGYQNVAWPDLVSAPGALALQEQGFTVEKHLNLTGDELEALFEKGRTAGRWRARGRRPGGLGINGRRKTNLRRFGGRHKFAGKINIGRGHADKVRAFSELLRLNLRFFVIVLQNPRLLHQKSHLGGRLPQGVADTAESLVNQTKINAEKNSSS